MHFNFKYPVAKSSLVMLPIMFFVFFLTSCGNNLLKEEWVQQITKEKQVLGAEYMDLIGRIREFQGHTLQQYSTGTLAANPEAGGHLTMLSETQRELIEMNSSLNEQYFKILSESEGKEATQEKWNHFKEEQRVLLDDFHRRVDETLRLLETEMNQPRPHAGDAPPPVIRYKADGTTQD